MITRVASLRDRGEPQDDDVIVTRPGRWGNPFTVDRFGVSRAVYLYHAWLTGPSWARWSTTTGEMCPAPTIVPTYDAPLRPTQPDVASLAGKRLLCACAPDALACHAWILAEEVARLTGVPVEPAPGRERT